MSYKITTTVKYQNFQVTMSEPSNWAPDMTTTYTFKPLGYFDRTREALEVESRVGKSSIMYRKDEGGWEKIDDLKSEEDIDRAIKSLKLGFIGRKTWKKIVADLAKKESK